MPNINIEMCIFAAENGFNVENIGSLAKPCVEKLV